MGILHVSLYMEIGQIEGIVKPILTSSKKSTTYFFMKFAQFEE